MNENQTTSRIATDTAALIGLLDRADSLPGAEKLRTRSYELLGAGPGTVVADVGCGAGRAVAELAGRGAQAVGVDPDERMITVAAGRWPDADFRLAGAYDLPFADGSLHGYRADKVYHVLDDPARALAEARRVLAPGGRIVLIGQDWDTIVIDADDATLTRTIVHARADLVPSPRVVRRTRNLLLDAGFTDVTCEVHTQVFTDEAMVPVLANLADMSRTAGAITAEQAESWVAEQRERGRRGRLFLALPMFVTAATRA
ncbi:methyltransferase [[Actinomadura] parvosata subsp. kistnae]|uniref:Methyltransferase n=1 Tax=[Actinomadura] parvosata subsp. kistnae TaxID=1909395 RepID=A0A1U9ZQP4_9ACTN|nr:methyltransferase domain-containing protein [Nonomuraea sp. ATCC 55076]AQZ60273.1 methyltransferase [Nonomuraea sp. ATCC 55076]SPL91232.1 methyltransferase [Actinomadura parvosata subsp. kistnae]